MENIERLTSRIQRLPPSVPVYSYHCIISGEEARPFPRFNHGQERSVFKLRYSYPNQYRMNTAYPVRFPAFLFVRWNSQKEADIRNVLMSTATTHPMGVAFHIHQVVRMFQVRNARLAYRKTNEWFLWQAVIRSSTMSSGTKETNRMIPGTPSIQPLLSISPDRMHIPARING